jgi:hypothetical protein
MYGHPAEDLELDLIEQTFPACKIINPADYGSDPKKLADTLGFCFGLVDTVDRVVFSRLLGKVTAGVGAEINYALGAKKAVYELKGQGTSWKFLPVLKPVRYISRAATRDLYRTFRMRDY